jgi:hypothetical protein
VERVNPVLSVYTFVPRGAHASYYYRVIVPLKTAADLSLPVRAFIDTDDPNIDPQQRMIQYCNSDLVLLYQPVGEGPVMHTRMAKSHLPSKMENGWKHPPTVIIDSDDNLFNVNPLNPAFKGLGIRDHEGRDITPGATIGIVQDGERKPLYVDGKDGFSVAQNRHNLDTYRTLIDTSDCVTCSTEHVAAAVKRDASPQRTKVMPNLVRFQDYEQIDLVKDPKRLKIMWQGGANHYEDWHPLKKQVVSLTERYPHIHWIFWGVNYHWVTEAIPPDRFTFKDWCPYQEYKLRLVTIGHDIALAPLSDNRFNKCRTAIKAYEAAVLKHPAAVLAQDTGPYHDELLNGETALLFGTPDEFETQLSKLIEDETLRKTLASNCKDWVNENRNANREVPKWVQYWFELRSEIVRDQPHMPEAQWGAFVQRMEAEQAAQEAQAREQPIHT